MTDPANEKDSKQAQEQTAQNDNAGVITIPPFIHIGFLALAIGLHYVWPIDMLPAPWQYILPTLLVLIAVYLGKQSVPEFKKTGTTLDVRTPTTAIITSGAYQYTRNPIYLGMAILHIAIGILIDNLWAVLTVIPAMIVMTEGVIKREEKYLEGKFGDSYRNYKSQVRRWL